MMTLTPSEVEEILTNRMDQRYDEDVKILSFIRHQQERILELQEINDSLLRENINLKNELDE